MEQLVEDIRHLPAFALVGLLVFVVGAMLDVMYHAAPAAWHPFLESYLGPDGQNAHILTFVGMIWIVVAVLWHARSSTKR